MVHLQDISADLTELGRTPVAVVCAGVKSILDIGKTLEYLVFSSHWHFEQLIRRWLLQETQGVTVAAFGTKQFPAFFTVDSGFEAPFAFNSVKQCADVIGESDELRLCAVPSECAHALLSGWPCVRAHRAKPSAAAAERHGDRGAGARAAGRARRARGEGHAHRAGRGEVRTRTPALLSCFVQARPVALLLWSRVGVRFT